jgi:NTP pyrophosphatase (non-canonical NTP hydrolase)
MRRKKYASTGSFERYVRTSWRHRDPLRELAIAGLGVSGEAGEVSEHIKKTIRDYKARIALYPQYKKRKLLLELGDVLHYLTRIAYLYGFSLNQIMGENMHKLNMRYQHKRRPV